MAKNYTVRAIADQTGVSVATVSRVLNNRPGISERARDAVLKAVNGAGYRVRNDGSITQIGVVYTRAESGVMRGYDADLVSGVYQGLSDRHAQMAITDLSHMRPGETYTQFFLRLHIDGIVLRISDENHTSVAEQIAAEQFPCVVASERYEGNTVSYVDYDSRVGVSRAIDYLVQLGHKRIAIAMPHVRKTDHYDRLVAYRDGLKRHQIELKSEWVVPIASTLQGGASAIDQLMAMSAPPTAVMFTNPPPTIGAIRRALQRGLKIPGDLSIVGYDNAELRHSLFPSFTAVCQDAVMIGQKAAAAVMDRVMNRELPAYQEVIPTLFEVNETTGAPA